MSRMAEPVEPRLDGIPEAALDGRRGVYLIEMEQEPRAGDLDDGEIPWTSLRIAARGGDVRCEITLAGAESPSVIVRGSADPRMTLEALGSDPRIMRKFADGLVAEARGLAPGGGMGQSEGGRPTMGELFR